MKSTKFLKRFLSSRREGFYLRVLREGEVGAGDEIKRIKVDPKRMSVREITKLLFFDRGNLKGFKKALKIKSLLPNLRESLEHRLITEGVSKRCSKITKDEKSFSTWIYFFYLHSLSIYLWDLGYILE